MSTTSLETHHGERDGVRTLWVDLAVDPTMTLWFGVGHQDMTPRTAGITHLVEHLVMRRLGHVVIPHNAESGMVSTQFYATGSPSRLVDFVARVCEAVRWVRDVTDDDLALERRTILAEIGMPSLYANADPFSVRYGLRGMGLSAVSHTRLLDWTAAEVRAVAQDWFHAGNAMLVSTSPLPDDLRLPLPAGASRERTAPPADILPGPSWVRTGADGVLLSGTVTGAAGETARNLAVAVLQDVLQAQLRTTLGQVYSVGVVGFGLAAGHDVVVLSLDPGPGSVCDVVVGACDVLERLATEGPTADELERTRSALLEEIELGAGRAQWLDSFASRSVRGVQPVELADDLAALRAATPTDLRGPSAQLLASLLVVFPGDHEPTDAARSRLAGVGATEIDLYAGADQDDRGGRRFRGRYFSPARGLTITVHDDRLVLASRTDRLTVHLADVELVGTDSDDDVELVTSRGSHVLVSPGQFRGFAKPFRTALDRIPATALRYDKERVAVRPDGSEPPAAI